MIYEYECTECKSRATAQRKMKDRNRGPECCGQMMEKRIFTATMAEFPEWNVSYKCVATGEEITSQAQRKRIMKERDLIDARDLGTPDFDALHQESINVKESASKPLPADLQAAIKREGLDGIL